MPRRRPLFMSSGSIPPARSTTTASTGASGSPLWTSTSCPAPSRISLTFEPKRRSGTIAAMRAITRRSLRAQAVELLPHGLRPAPPLHDLGPALAHAAHRELGLDAGVVEELQGPVHGR